MPLVPQRPCPCGAASYDACCGRLHRGEAVAATPEELMRSRYSAYAVGETGYVFRTWHPRTRPEDVAPEPGLRWTGLEIIDAPDGTHDGVHYGDGETGVVEFRATYETEAGAGVLHERSRFARRAGRWLYLDGDLLAD